MGKYKLILLLKRSLWLLGGKWIWGWWQWKQRDGLEIPAIYQEGDKGEFGYACCLVMPGPWVAICEHG